jgi:hypothetical protein
MVTPRESLISNAVAAWYSARKFGYSNTMDSGLVTLEVCEASEVRRRGACSNVASPCSV